MVSLPKKPAEVVAPKARAVSKSTMSDGASTEHILSGVRKPGRTVARAAATSLHTMLPKGASAQAFAGETADLIAKMRNGTPAREILGIASDLGMSQERLLVLLRLPSSTIKKRISANANLSSTEQDRIYRASRVLQRAIEVFEDGAAAREWLSRSNRALGGELPLALLDTEVGYELVLDTLGRIEYGVFS